MANREIQSKKRYVLAFLIGSAIFIIGILISFSVSYLQYQRISNLQETISYDIFQDKILNSFFNKDICTNESFSKISGDLGFQGKIIDDLEKKFGKNDEKVLFRKKFYSLIEIEHFEFVRTLNKECKSNIDTILFFYSNEDEDIDDSEKVGDLLAVAYRKSDNLMIYSFDINLDSELIKSLKEKYRVEKSPTLIINEKIKITDIKNVEDIEKYLD